MKELTPEQIQENWDKLIQIINDNFSGERLEKLLEMYSYFEERMCLAPASGKEHFHNAHPGGYVEHVLHIVDSEDNYIHNDSDWHRKNQGLIYKHNPKLQYMTITDRACWLLQHFGINMSENEYIGLRLTDGLYEEANKTYYMNWSKDNQLATNIAYILHQADMMASKIEYDEWARGDHDIKAEKEEEVNKKSQQSAAANQAFKDLFGE